MNLPPATILGIGVVTPLGRDLSTIARKLAEPPTSSASHPVDESLLSDVAINRRMRRADRFSRMAAIAACDAWKQTPQDVPLERVGLIIASGLGPYNRTFRFLDGILEGGDANASPTDFSHSVHGAAAAYITELLELRGPCMTVTDFENGFEQSVQLAQCWLADGTCSRVIVGAVEELGDVLLHCVGRLDARVAPGEGAVFLMLGPSDLAGVAHLDATRLPEHVDLLMVDDPPLLPADVPLQITAARTTSFTPHFGHIATGSAFQILGALLSAAANSVDSAATVKPLWRSASATLCLTKNKAI
jgi:3-oxoacyl-[acyl-carrier-protein] synthase II